MSWQAEVDEIAKRKALATAHGGEEAVRRHREHGKLLARERIERVLDPGSFSEIGSLTGKAKYDKEHQLADLTPSNAIIGKGRIEGRKVVVTSDDFTLRGGSSESTISEKWIYGEIYAYEMHYPLVRLVESAGGSVRLLEMAGATKIPGYPTWPMGRMLGVIPVVGIALGACAGLGAMRVACAHFSVMVKGIGQVFAAGPPVVSAGMNQKIHKEDLGGSKLHARGTGVVHNEAESEDDAFRQARRFLSYLPPSVYELPPRATPTDTPDRREEKLLSIVPRERRRVYHSRKILEWVLDKDSIFEIGRYNGPSIITALARVNGYPVGVIANDPYYYGGAMTRVAGEKMEAFIDLCDTFHLPVVNFVDQPGVMIGLDAERAGTMKAGLRVLTAIEQSRVPWCAVITRRLFGVAGTTYGRIQGINLRYAWPSAIWGSIPIEGGIAAAYRREIDAAPDPAAKTQELETKYQHYQSPFLTAERFGVNDIIDPRDTRPLLCDFVEEAYHLLPEQLGPIGRTMRG